MDGPRADARLKTAHHQAVPALMVRPATVTAQMVMVPTDTPAPMVGRRARCSHPSDLFKRFDANRDGQLSMVEFGQLSEFVREHRPMGPPPGGPDGRGFGRGPGGPDGHDGPPPRWRDRGDGRPGPPPRPMTAPLPVPTARRRKPSTKTSPAPIKQP